MRKQNIVFVGFRGAGKSRFGKAVAKVAGLPFADLDQEVEFVLGESIESFVEKYGWQVFREVEQRVCHDFARNFSGVIATGGGTIENSKNLQNLKKTGMFIFLNPDFFEVRKFLLSPEGQNGRPRMNPDVPLSQEIDQMWTQRKDIYSATADFEVEPDYHGNEKKEAQKILKQLPAAQLPEVPPERKIAFFSSSGGTTMQGIFEAKKRGRIPNVTFELFVTDTPDCEALKKAKKAKIPHIEILEFHSDETREEYDRALLNLVRQHQPDLILLAGWMRILSPLYCEQFSSITYNVHPSLLPEHAGLKGDDVHAAVLNAGENYTGCTIHRVSTEVDAGEQILQRKIPVDPNDTVDTLRPKVQRQEILGFCEALERRK